MLDFPRWKYALVAIVMLIAALFALPNVFGEQPALQVERRDRVAMDVTATKQVMDLLRQRGVQDGGSYIDSGRLMVRFRVVNEQLKARDVVNETLETTYRSALAFAPNTPAWLRAIGLKPMPLGLDLRGGLYLLYQVDVNSAVSQLLESYQQGFRRSLNSAELAFTDIGTLTTGDSTIPNTLRITLPPGAGAQAVRDLLARENSDLTLSVVNLPDGPAVDMTLTPTQIRARQDYAIEQTRTTLSNRVNELGVSEPIVQRQGLDRVNVQLPGVQNSAEVKDILGKVATLEFRLEDWQNNAYDAQSRGRAPLGSKLYKDSNGQPVLLKRELIATGDQLTNATSSVGDQGPQVNVTFNGRGGDSMFRNTRTNVGRRMAVVYVEKSRKTVDVGGQKVEREVTDERVISLATIQSVLSNQFRITGLNSGESKELALLMRSGSLAATIYPVSERAIGPSLGADNINKGVNALLIGMTAVFLFMAIYYLAFGLVADAVLLANVVLLTALLSIMRASLTLPGIAGIILTVGIAVDANVLIYERIREELRNNVSPQAAIRAGFDKAFSAILDSNVTALIAGIVLWVVGTGAIRGFAVVLTLGIATSMFTSLLGSRALITLMYGGARKVERLAIG
jgi:preprotein translocase subunit SecD